MLVILKEVHHNSPELKFGLSNSQKTQMYLTQLYKMEKSGKSSRFKSWNQLMFGIFAR